MCNPVIKSTIQELRHVFESNFDQSWFLVIIESLPLTIKNIREIRELLYSDIINTVNLQNIKEKIKNLETFILVIREYLLPVIKEKLQISYLAPKNIVYDRDKFVLRQFIAYTLPHNLNKLNTLTKQLKSNLNIYN